MNDIYCWESKYEGCYYSNRLLSKLLSINDKHLLKNQIDLLEVKKAIYYAKKYHDKQKRQSGEPFYSHPLEVAYNVADYCFKTDILVTSILHDTIEDTKLNKQIINYLFNSNVANQVDALTRIKKNKKITIEEMISLLLIHKNCDELLLVKYFDRVHNIQNIQVKPSEKILQTISETLKNFVTVELYLKLIFPNLSKSYNNIISLCYQSVAGSLPLS